MRVRRGVRPARESPVVSDRPIGGYGALRHLGRCPDGRAVASEREWNADNESTLRRRSRNAHQEHGGRDAHRRDPTHARQGPHRGAARVVLGERLPAARAAHSRGVAGAPARGHRRDGRAQPGTDRLGPGLRPRARPHRRRPRLRRVTSPVDHHPDYWAYARDSLLVDVAPTSSGPDVKFHHSKLNFKWARGGEEVKWHQDIQYWPHTNYSPLTVGTYLYDCGTEQGPLGVLPGSHDGPLYDLYDDDGAGSAACRRPTTPPARHRAHRVPDRPGRAR